MTVRELDNLRVQLEQYSDERLARAVDPYTLADVCGRALAEIDRLHAQESEIAAALWPDKRDGDTWSSAFFVQEIERLQAKLSAAYRTHAEEKHYGTEMQIQRDQAMALLGDERKRAEFWKAECEERAVWIEESWQEGNYCPSCALVTDEHVPHCSLVRLMTMPEEPKP